MLHKTSHFTAAVCLLGISMFDREIIKPANSARTVVVYTSARYSSISIHILYTLIRMQTRSAIDDTTYAHLLFT